MDTGQYDSRVERPARILSSAGFIAGLVLLLVNDLVLKQAYPGGVPGKLSDFAGLFVFPMFWAAFRPRWSREIYAATALAFVWWKSPWSQRAIDGWNALALWDVGRVVDWTDLAALAVLPLSFFYLAHLAQRAPSDQRTMRLRIMPVVVTLSAFAFAATSYGGKSYDLTPGDPANTYSIEFPFDEFSQRLDETGLWHSMTDGYVAIGADCQYANIRVSSTDASTGLTLTHLGTHINCDGAKAGEGELRRKFEEEVVKRLAREKPPFYESTRARGNRIDYAEDSRLRRVVDAPAIEVAQLMDAYPEPHELRGNEYLQRLGYGYSVRFILRPLGERTEFEVLGYINRDGGEKSAQEMEPRFQYYLDYILGRAAARDP